MLRFAVSEAMGNFSSGHFPYATLLVNVIGCFSIGAVYALFSSSPQFLVSIKPFVVVGVLGGFTTFSSYAMELVTLTNSLQWAKFLTYFLLSNVLGFAAAWFSFYLFSN